jgi:hypothetical protein
MSHPVVPSPSPPPCQRDGERDKPGTDGVVELIRRPAWERVVGPRHSARATSRAVCGAARGLTDEVAPCADVLAKIVADAEELIAGRLSRTIS